MPDDSPDVETEIIRAAYADKVKDAFMVFAENLAVGQGEKSCKERFLRSLQLIKKARDLALQVMSGEDVVEPSAPSGETAPNSDEPHSDASATGGLSAQDQALIEQALDRTTGPGRPARLR